MEEQLESSLMGKDRTGVQIQVYILPLKLLRGKINHLKHSRGSESTNLAVAMTVAEFAL